MSSFLEIAKRLNALAQAGLTYSTNPYDLERFEEIQSIGVEMLSLLTDESVEKIAPLFATNIGEYPTPKVDIRAVIFRGTDEILMVQEKIDHLRWTLPGGWADVGYTPSEIAVKETEEETGLIVVPKRLLAVFDKREHPHPPQPWYVYKFFIRCETVGGAIKTDGHDIGSVRWVKRTEIPTLSLSEDRVTASQLETIFDFVTNPDAPTLCD